MVLCLVVLLLTGLLQAQPVGKQPEWKLARTITTADGLPINSISALEKAPDGLIWIGTADGLVFSDGYQILKKPAFEIPAILQKGSLILDIQQVGLSMFVNSSDTAFIWNHGHWTGLAEPFHTALLSPLGSQLYEARKRTAFNSGLLVKFDGHQFDVADSLNPDEPALAIQDGILYTLKQNQIYGYDFKNGKKGKQQPIAFSVSENRNFVAFGRAGRFGLLMVEEEDDGSFIFTLEFEAGKAISIPVEAHFRKKKSVAEPWITFPRVITEMGNDIFQVMKTNQFCFLIHLKNTENGVKAVLTDFDEGFMIDRIPVSTSEFWISKGASGVEVYRHSSAFKTILTGDKLIKSLVFGTNGQLASITNAPSLTVSRFDVLRTIQVDEVLIKDSNLEMVNLKHRPEGSLIVNAGREGIWQWDFEFNLEKRKRLLPYLSKNVLQMVLDADSMYLWVMTDFTLKRVNLESGKVEETGFKFNVFSSVWNIWGLGNKNTLWFNDESELYVLDKKSLQVESFKKPPFLSQRLRTFSVDKVFAEQDLLWVGSTDGIAAFDRKNKKWIQVETAREWPSTFIYGIIPHKKDLWISTNSGIVRFTPRFEGDTITGPVRFFTKEDGLASTEFNSFSFARREDGLIAFGGIEGITLFHPDSIPAASILAKPVLTRIELFDQFFPFEPGKTAAFNSEQNQFRFHYSAVNASDPAKVSFEVRLLGQEQNWLKQENRRDVLFPAISHGEYAFQVRLTNEDGIVLPEETLFRFEILPPFWLRWWFLSGAGLILIAGIVQTVRIISTRKLRQRIRELELERKLQEERQKTRAQIARDLHDEVSSTLSAVSMLASRADAASDSETRGRIHEQLVEARSSMEEMIWSLSPRNDKLDKLLFRISDLAIDFAAQANFETDISIPSEIPDLQLPHETRKHIYLIVKEALTNAAKYSGANKLIMTASIEENNTLMLVVADNGKGFDLEKAAQRSRGGNGLHNMRDRAAAMGAALTIESGSTGTAVSLKVALAV
jgi:signal transduction histidine kinase